MDESFPVRKTFAPFLYLVRTPIDVHSAIALQNGEAGLSLPIFT